MIFDQKEAYFHSSMCTKQFTSDPRVRGLNPLLKSVKELHSQSLVKP